MAEFDDRLAPSRADVGRVEVDQGLRNYMLGIYNYMALGVALTGVAAWVIANTELRDIFFVYTAGVGFRPTMLGWVGMIAPIGLVLTMGMGFQRFSSTTLQGVFWLYASLVGIAIASILLNFTGESVARVFFISAAAFGALSLYGYTTKSDLSGWGSFLIMGVIGLIIAIVVNAFLQSSALHFAVSVIGVLVFAGLTAYDTQRLKNTYFEVAGNAEALAKVTIMGALSLYLDFINMFIFLMQLLGNRE